MKTFDSIHVRRPALAQGYLALLQSQSGRPIALFAGRRIGKTYFLQNDLISAGEKAGFLPVYADLWLNRGDAIQSINHALEEALDDIRIPGGSVGRIAKTPVRKIAGVEFGDEPARRPLPEDPKLRLDTLVSRLAAAAGKPILLMLDEIQSLAESANGNEVIAAIRAVLTKQKSKVHAVFTGSSQNALSQMMTSIGAPMYQFAQLLDFPPLDEAYLRLLADHFASIHPDKKLDPDRMQEVFSHIGHKPALMKDLIKEMSAEGSIDFDCALRRFIADERQAIGWQSQFDALVPLEQALLICITYDVAPMAKDTLLALTKSCGETVTISKVRHALDRLRKGGVLTKQQTGNRIADTLFASYLKTKYSPTQVSVIRRMRSSKA